MIHTFIIAAVSADGYIAQSPSQVSTEWTSDEDKKFFSERTKKAGVVVMGARTFETIGKPLPGRRTIVYSEKEINCAGIETTNKEPRALLGELEKQGCKEVAICGGATIYTFFMQAGLVQTMYLTVHPVLFGSGVPLFNTPLSEKLSLVESKHLSPDVVLLEYRVS